MSGIYDLLTEAKGSTRREAWTKKMIHQIPECSVVQRVQFLEGRVKGKKIVHLGFSSGDLHRKLSHSAHVAFGIDRDESEWPGQTAVCDLDRLDDDDIRDGRIPFRDEQIDVIVAGEILEHLSNPGRALEAIRASWPNAELVVTVPNAYSANGWRSVVHNGVECVNADHVNWYSWYTLTNLLKRSGWGVVEFYWYNGAPKVAEGMVAIARASSDEGAERKASCGIEGEASPVGGTPQETGCEDRTD